MSTTNFIKVVPSDLDRRFKQLRTITELSVKSMVASLEKRGQLTPIVIADDGARHIVIDGFKRCAAAEILRMSLMAMIIPGEGALMKAHMYLLNRKRGFSMIEEGMLVRELVEGDGLKQVEVAVMLERHKSWVSRRLEMIRALSSPIVEDLKLGLLPPGSATALARLPSCNQVDLSAVIQAHKLQAKESGILIDLWCKAKNDEYRTYLLKFPEKAIELATGKEKKKPDPAIGEKVSTVLTLLQELKRLAALFCIKSQKPIGTLDKNLYEIVERAVDGAESQCQQALKSARELLVTTREADINPCQISIGGSQ
jgi:ParB-like chromosome segregation protein Spo0J